MTLLQLEERQKFAVIEVGADKPGEIEYGASLIKPNVAVITGVGKAHLSGFGDMDGVAQEKAKLLRHLTADGTAVVPADSPYDELWHKEAGGRRVVRYGDSDSRDTDIHIKAEACQQHSDGLSFVVNVNGNDNDNDNGSGEKTKVSIPILGKHNCRNAAAAFAAVLALGGSKLSPAKIAGALNAYRLPPGRLQLHRLREGGTLIDDSYNANPDSTLAAMRTLADLDGYKMLVLGDMLELGGTAAEAHRKIGETASELKLDEVLTVGDLANLAVEQLNKTDTKKTIGKKFNSQTELTDYLLNKDWRKSVCLIKGSRGAAMETVVRPLLNKFGEKNGHLSH